MTQPSGPIGDAMMISMMPNETIRAAWDAKRDNGEVMRSQLALAEQLASGAKRED